MAEKTYVDGLRIKTRETSFGDVLKVGIRAEDLIAFLEKHKNEAGFVNIDIMKRKNASDKGETHYAVLDTWKPSGGEGQSSGTSKPANKPAAAPKQPASNASAEPDPFGSNDEFGGF